MQFSIRSRSYLAIVASMSLLVLVLWLALRAASASAALPARSPALSLASPSPAVLGDQPVGGVQVWAAARWDARRAGRARGGVAIVPGASSNVARVKRLDVGSYSVSLLAPLPEGAAGLVFVQPFHAVVFGGGAWPIPVMCSGAQVSQDRVHVLCWDGRLQPVDPAIVQFRLDAIVPVRQELRQAE